MSDTPRTDEEARRITLDCDDSCVEIYVKRDSKTIEGDIVVANFARQLERELNAAKAALSGRTVSCSNCNEAAKPCDWKQDEDGNWDTQCGKSMCFEFGSPNDYGYKFCPSCGHPINFITFIESLV